MNSWVRIVLFVFGIRSNFKKQIIHYSVFIKFEKTKIFGIWSIFTICGNSGFSSFVQTLTFASLNNEHRVEFYPSMVDDWLRLPFGLVTEQVLMYQLVPRINCINELIELGKTSIKKNSKMNDVGHLFFRPPYPMDIMT